VENPPHGDRKEKVEWGLVSVVALGAIAVVLGLALWITSIAVLAVTYAGAVACGRAVDGLDAAVETSLKAVGYASLMLIVAGLALVVAPFAVLTAVLLKKHRQPTS